MDGFELVEKDKIDIEKRKKWQLMAIFEIFRRSRNDAMERLRDLNIELLSRSWQLSTETLTEAIESLMLEKVEFSKLGSSTLMGTVCPFGI